MPGTVLSTWREFAHFFFPPSNLGNLGYYPRLPIILVT